MFEWKKLGLFAGGVLFGTAGIAILKSTDMKKAYTQCTAAVLRGKDSVVKCGTSFKERLTDYDCFPHEIGLFLGFPVEDVKAFIEKDGHDCLTCGFWKVYCNKSQALETFRQYKICARIYNEAADLKIPVTRMTVNLRNVDISRGYRKAS